MHRTQFCKMTQIKDNCLIRIVCVLRIGYSFLHFWIFILCSRCNIMENVNRSLLLTKVETSVWDQYLRTQTRTKMYYKMLSFSLQLALMCFFLIFFFSFYLSKRSNYLQMNVQNSTTKNNNSLLSYLFPAATFSHAYIRYSINTLIHTWIESSFSVEWHMMPPFRSIQQQQQQQ